MRWKTKQQPIIGFSHRIQPVIASASPGWLRTSEHFFDVRFLPSVGWFFTVLFSSRTFSNKSKQT